ncbi:outer membrane protein [Dongshaea marina]|uniref:outer membrane protein n=1 Tax=Dongshaea marina TaxID=2047966 RepID=UPI000D3E5B44|nr:outer membrane beta-barrel protein [Dongshaea marina]
MKKIAVVAALAGAMACGSAMAQVSPYVGLNFGVGGMQMDDILSSNIANSSSDVGGAAGGVNVGFLAGHTPFQYGAEMGYYTYADNTYHYSSPFGSLHVLNGKYQGHYIDLLGVGKYSFSNGWNIFGKAGAAYVTQELTLSSDTVSGEYDKTEHKLLPKLAIGVGYDFTPNWSASVEMSQVFGDKPAQFGSAGSEDDYNKVASVGMLTMGVAYHF